MSLTRLDIFQFRNLHQVLLQPDAGLNLLIGPNAAGKTSLLETIFYLSYGRSFRSSQTRDLITYGQDLFRLVGKIDDTATVGIQKSTREQIIRVNQKTVQRISDLSALLPVIALHPDSHQLIAAGPEYRRQYLDWGVFHVEPAFIQVWKDFRKALAQRNAALRHQESDRICQLWNQPLVDNAQRIEDMRLDYLGKLEGLVERYAQCLFPGHQVNLEYRRGWAEDEEYAVYLESRLGADREKGYTQGGPHRAELKIRLDGKPAQTAASRGQQKKLVALLKLAQLDLFNETTNKTCVLLYDDLPAELDKENRRILLELLSSMKVQLFISAIEKEQVDLSLFESARMFHVERGGITHLIE